MVAPGELDLLCTAEPKCPVISMDCSTVEVPWELKYC